MDTKDQIKTNNQAEIVVDNPILQDSSAEDKKALETEIKFLATSWLDDFEKKTFNGKTINELLNQRIYE